MGRVFLKPVPGTSRNAGQPQDRWLFLAKMLPRPTPTSAPRQARLLVLLLISLLALPGCALLDLRRNVKDLASHGIVALLVSPPPRDGAPVYVLAMPSSNPSGSEILAVQRTASNGVATFLLPDDATYAVAAFADRNGNRTYDPGEPSAMISSVTAQAVSDTVPRSGPFRLNLSTQPSGLPAGLKVPTAGTDLESSLQTSLGEVVTLNDPRFSAANGSLGLWEPYQFLTKLGWGIYFLQPYDPTKIPVVFVYGINGSPQDWRGILASLDQSKYQPWFFHYPSGLRLEKSALGLSRGLQILRAQYQIPKVYVVAHSMGGLVSRRAVQQSVREAGTNFIPKFITLCTPWGGDASADSGVKHIRYPVPAWIDMQPGSAYLASLFSRPLPTGTDYSLIFSFQTHQAPWLKPDNDGIVQVASQLLPAAQTEAGKMFGFNYGHVEALQEKDVQAKLGEFLAD